MFSHVTLGTNDYARSEKFYDAVMGALGHPVMFNAGGTAAYGTPTGPKVGNRRSIDLGVIHFRRF